MVQGAGLVPCSPRKTAGLRSDTLRFRFFHRGKTFLRPRAQDRGAVFPTPFPRFESPHQESNINLG